MLSSLYIASDSYRSLESLERVLCVAYNIVSKVGVNAFFSYISVSINYIYQLTNVLVKSNIINDIIIYNQFNNSYNYYYFLLYFEMNRVIHLE